MLPAPIVIATPAHNSEGKHDATGAFIPCGDAFRRVHGVRAEQVVRVDNTLPQLKRAIQLVGVLERERPRVFVQLSHGYTHGTQLGPRSPGHPRFREGGNPIVWARMVRALAAYGDPTVVLYACSTGDDPDDDPESAPGSGDGSYADALRDALCQAGATTCRVVAHTTAGHAVRNPHVKFFDGMGSALGGVGAVPLAPPGMLRVLARMLQTDFAYRFPFMSVAEIHEHLAQAAIVR